MTADTARYGRGTAGLATAAVAALSASALAGLVWLGADQLAGAPGGHSAGAPGDLGLAPAQVDLGSPPAVRIGRIPAQPSGLAAPVTAGTTGGGTTVPLVPVQQPGIPPTSAGGPGSPGTPGKPGGGPSTPPVLELPHGNRWAIQLVVSLRDGLGEVAANIASLDVPGTGTLPSADSPRSRQARVAAENRVLWALVRADRKATLSAATTQIDATTGSGDGHGTHGAATTATGLNETSRSHPSGSAARPVAAPTDQAAAQDSGQGKDAGNGTGSGHDDSPYQGKHRKG